MEVSDLVICALVALVTLLVAAVFYESKAARAGDAAGEGLSEREARLSDLRAWEKAVKLFSSALKDADASARAALCKDPEGEIEKLMEGQTVEKVTGEQAQEDAP